MALPITTMIFNRMPTTLADIARELGISKMTVSRAINNHPEINAETRERILAVARRLNYRPNQHARALATNRSFLLGLVVPDLMHSYYAEILHSIESIARPAGFQIVICNTEEDGEREIEEVEAIRYRTDGLIIASTLKSSELKTYQIWWLPNFEAHYLVVPTASESRLS